MRGLIAHFASRNGHQNGHRKTSPLSRSAPSRTVTPVNALGASATVYACVKRRRTPPCRCRSTSIDAAPTDPGSGVAEIDARYRERRALTLPTRCLRFSQRGARRSARHSRAAGRPFLPLWRSVLHALAEAATRVLARRLRASLHPTAEAAEAQAAEPPREPFAEASEAASRRTATHALGKAVLGLVGCGGVLVRRCHRDAPLVVPAA